MQIYYRGGVSSSVGNARSSLGWHRPPGKYFELCQLNLRRRTHANIISELAEKLTQIMA
jgi:hypothetical protein